MSDQLRRLAQAVVDAWDSGPHDSDRHDAITRLREYLHANPPPESAREVLAVDSRPCPLCGSSVCNHKQPPMPGPDDAGWRVGRKLGRTLYVDGTVVGMVDTRELATAIVDAMNALRMKEKP